MAKAFVLINEQHIPVDVTGANALKVDSSATTQPISASSLPLPTGATTETTLLSINTKTPALGQALMSVSTPVVIASDQSSLTVNQATHDNLNLNANLQIANADVSVSNRVPVSAEQQHVVDSGSDIYVAGTTEGALAIGRVIDNETPPTLTIGQISGLTLHTDGSLRVLRGDKPPVETPLEATEADQVFSLFLSGFNLSPSGTELPVLIIRNPGGSGKVLYLRNLGLNNEVKTQTSKVRVYKDPTVTVDGTPVTPANFKIGSVVTSVITPFSGPTISSNGTQLTVAATGANQNDLRRDFDFAIFLPPGTDLLFTGEGSNNNTLIDIAVEWAEV